MAEQDHLDVLHQGRDVWNHWRQEHHRQGQPLLRFEKTPLHCFSMLVQKWLFHFCHKQ